MNAFVARLRAAPPSMWVAAVGSVLSAGLVFYAGSKLGSDGSGVSESSYDEYARLMTAKVGLSFAVRVLMAGGILTAAAVAVRARTLLLVAAGLVAVLVVVRAVGWPLYPFILDHTEQSYQRMRYIDMAAGVGGVAAIVLISVAAARSAVMPLFAALAVGGALVAWNLPGMGELLREALAGERVLATLVYAAAELVMLVGIAGLLGAILHDHPPTPDPRLAVRGLRLIEKGLLLKAIMPLVLMLLVIAAVLGARSATPLKFMLVAGALALVSAWTIVGLGALTLVRSHLEGLSASKLLLGAGVVMWWSIVYFQQALSLYAALFDSERSREFPTDWTVAGPLVAAGGFLLLGWAMVSFAKVRGDEELATAATARTATVVIIDVVVVLVTHYLTTKQAGPGVLFAVAGAIASIIGTLAFAKLFARVAAMVESQPALPLAAIVSKGAR